MPRVSKNSRELKLDHATKLRRVQAKRAFLAGETDMGKLMEIGGCTLQTIYKWVNEWSDEVNERAISSYQGDCQLNALQLQVTEDELLEAKKTKDTTAHVKGKLEKELRDVDASCELIRDLLKKLKEHPNFEETSFKECLSALRIYADVTSLRTRLIADFQRVSRLYDEKSHAQIQFEALRGAAKSQAVAIAKQQLEESENSHVEDDSDAGDVFGVS